MKYQQKILTPQGEVPLEDIAIGADVIGYNYETKQQEVYQLVHKSPWTPGKGFIDHDHKCEGKYKFRFNKKKNWIEINKKFSFIPHQSLYANGNVIHAFELKIGDVIELVDGRKIIVKHLRTIDLETPKYLVTIEKKQTAFQKLLKKKPKQFHTYYLNGVLVHNASRFFVGSGTNWSSTGSWSGSSGGGSGASVPTAADDVLLNASSPGNLTIDAASVCRSIDATGFTHTLTHNAFTLSIGTSSSQASKIALKFPTSGWIYTLTDVINSAISFVGTSADITTADFGGKTTGNVTINTGTTTTIQLTTNGFTCGATATVTLTQGEFDTNGQTCSWGLFNSSNTNTRTLTLGASNITLTSGVGTAVWQTATGTGITFNANTSTITLTGINANFATSPALTFNNLVFSGSGGQVIGDNTKCLNLTRTGAANKSSGFQSQGTVTVTGLLTITGNSQTNRVIVTSNSRGTQKTFVLGTTGTVALTNVDFQDIIFTGTSTPVSGTSVADAANNSGITFTTPVTRFWVGNGGLWSDTNHWSTSSGGAVGASVPIAQDTIIFDANSITSAGQTITMDMDWASRMDFTNILNNPTLSLLDPFSGSGCLGDFILKSGMTLSQTNFFAIGGASNSSITTNGVSIKNQISISANIGVVVTLTDNYTSTNQLQLNSGTLTANGNVTVSSFVSASNRNTTRTLNMGSGTWTLTGTGTVWQFATTAHLTHNAQTSTIVISDTSATSKAFIGGGFAFNNISITGDGTGAVTFDGGNSFNIFTIGGPKTITFTHATTTTITTIAWTGSSGNLITLNSDLAGTAANIALATPQEGTWLSVKDINASNQTLYAGHNSTNVSGNTNVVFADYFTSTLTDTESLTETLIKSISRLFIGSILYQGLIDYYKLDDVKDSIGNHDLINNNGITFVPAVIGNGADLGAGNTNKWLSLADNLGIHGDAVSFAFRVKLYANPPSGFSWSFMIQVESLNNTGFQLYYQNNAGILQMVFNRVRLSVSNDSFLFNKDLNDGNFHTIGYTYDGITEKGYIDGNLVGSLAVSGNGVVGVGDQFVIGNDTSFGNPTSGIFDEFEVWNRALSDNEMYSLANDNLGLQLTESFQKANVKTYTESISLIASFARVITKQFNETLSLTEILIKITNYLLALADSITFHETFIKNSSFIKTDMLSIIEILRLKLDGEWYSKLKKKWYTLANNKWYALKRTAWFDKD